MNASLHRFEMIDVAKCYASPAAREVSPDHVAALAQSIHQIGLIQPISVRATDKGFQVIAGAHRLRAFENLGRAAIPAIIRETDDLRAELALIDENLIRNELTPAERAGAIWRRKAIYEALYPGTSHGAPGVSRQVGETRSRSDAERFTKATSEATFRSERAIQRDAHRGEALADDDLAKVTRTSLDKGDELDALAKLSRHSRGELIERAANGEKVSAKAAVKQQSRADREALLGATQTALPLQKYGVIVADPEWRFEPWSRRTGMDRAADNHYPTSCTEVIASRDVASIAAKDCVLFLWATAPMLPHALMVMEAWGFDYRSNYVWNKDRIGTGYWNRNAHEHLLIGVKGDIPAPAPGTQRASVIEGPVTKHSAKPECFLEMIEQYFPTLPKIELNRRGPARKGWAAWGNETVNAGDPSDQQQTPRANESETLPSNNPAEHLAFIGDHTPDEAGDPVKEAAE